MNASLRRLWLLSLVLVVIGARLLLIATYGSDVPYWDQWDAEWRLLLRPLLAGRLGLADLLAPHNEHRLFFTRLLDVAIFRLNGQWDPRLQMVVNACLYALVPAGLFLVYCRQRRPLFGLGWLLVLAAVFSLPYAWQNILEGFQSQFYLLAGFSLLCIRLLTGCRLPAGRYLAGGLCGAAVLLTMGSGLLAPAAAAATLLLVCCRQWPARQGADAGVVRGLLLTTLLIAAGIALAVEVPAHEQYRAHSLSQFLAAVSALLSWPWSGWPWWCLVAWLPFFLFLGAYAARRLPDAGDHRFLLGMGFWVLLQTAATAYSRAALIASSRYTDLLSFGLLVNLLAIVLLREHLRQRRLRHGAAIFLAVLVAVNGTGLYRASLDGSPARKGYTAAVETKSTAGYLRTGVPTFLVPEANRRLPYPDSLVLKGFLDDPLLRPILPAGIRETVPLQPAGGAPQRVDTADNGSPYPPYGWERRWQVTGAPAAFLVASDAPLPYLQLLLAGDGGSVTATDSAGNRLSVHRLASGHGPWQRLLIRCNAAPCRLSVVPGHTPLLLTDPTAVGSGSAWALLLTSRAKFLLRIGAAPFIIGIFLLLRQRRPRPSGGSVPS